MLSIHDAPDAADHDVAHLAVVSGKEKRIQDVVPLPSRQIDMVAVEHDQIGAFSRLQRARGPGQRLRTANRGGAPQCRTDGRAARIGGHVALLVAQALANSSQRNSSTGLTELLLSDPTA